MTIFNTALESHVVDPPAEIHRNAYNAAFSELGLPWHWDVKTHGTLQANAKERESLS